MSTKVDDVAPWSRVSTGRMETGAGAGESQEIEESDCLVCGVTNNKFYLKVEGKYKSLRISSDFHMHVLAHRTVMAHMLPHTWEHSHILNFKRPLVCILCPFSLPFSIAL